MRIKRGRRKRKRRMKTRGKRQKSKPLNSDEEEIKREETFRIFFFIAIWDK